METTRMWIICALVQQGKGRVNEQQMVWFNITVCLMDNFFPFFLVDFNNCRLFYSTSEHPFFLFLRIDGWKVVYSTSENDFFLLLNFLIMSHTVKQYRWGRASWTQFKFVMWQIHKSDRITEAGAILHFYLSRCRASVLVKEKWGRLHSKLDEKTEVNQKMAIRFPQSRGTLRQ